MLRQLYAILYKNIPVRLRTMSRIKIQSEVCQITSVYFFCREKNPDVIHSIYSANHAAQEYTVDIPYSWDFPYCRLQY